MANSETTPTTPTNAYNNRPALCSPTKRYEPKMRQEKASSNSRTPPQASKTSRSKRMHRRTNSAGGEDTSRSSLKRITGAVGGSPSKKIEALLTARFERLSDMDRVRRVRMNSEKLMKVLHIIAVHYKLITVSKLVSHMTYLHPLDRNPAPSFQSTGV